MIAKTARVMKLTSEIWQGHWSLKTNRESFHQTKTAGRHQQVGRRHTKYVFSVRIRQFLLTYQCCLCQCMMVGRHLHCHTKPGTSAAVHSREVASTLLHSRHPMYSTTPAKIMRPNLSYWQYFCWYKSVRVTRKMTTCDFK